MPLPEINTIIDLRAEALRKAQPLQTSLPVLAISLDDIEEGSHGLSADQGPFLVVCERGMRSGLAARYLRTDGLQAQHWQGNWDELVQALG